MKIALVAPPFIAVPPKKYGGTELFAGDLVQGLKQKEILVILYANGASTAPVETRWIIEKEEWPISSPVESSLKGLLHSSWAVQDASGEADVIHVNDAPSLAFSRFVDLPFVYTVHHAIDPSMTAYYQALPDNIYYVTISDYQRRKLPLSQIRTIHHGIDLSRYRVVERKQPYLVFLGRVAPTKGTHLAIEVAKLSGMPLKIAGEVQPIYKEYWETKVKPHIDGKFIEFVGDVGPEEKITLLGNATAMIFPIQWEEPFGLVMIESMACGTPVLAIPRGSVEEIVREGVSGCIRQSAAELAACIPNLNLDAGKIREYAQRNFSAERMADDYISLYKEILASRRHEADAEPIVA